MKNTKFEIRNSKFDPPRRTNFQFQKKKGFSLVELIIVILIIGILSVVSYIAIERSRSKAMNDKMLDDLIAIANALEDYKRDHQLFYPIPEPDTEDLINQNVLCYYADATYAHSCDPADGAVFVQGMIDNNLLSKRYLRDVPTDPRTGSRYVYGVTTDGKYFQVAGIYEREDGTYEARTVENLVKGFELPSIIRAYDSANFVIDKEIYLPYSPDHLMLTATIQNIDGIVSVKQSGSDKIKNIGEGFVLHNGDTVYTINATGSADIYFSDGSITHIDPDSMLVMENMEVAKNDRNGTITNILLNLKLGKIWSKVARLAQNSTFDIKTTGAIAGVRGTEYGVEVYPDSKMLKEVTVLSGEVDIKDLDNQILQKIEGATPTQPKQAVAPSYQPVSITDTSLINQIFKDYYKYIPLNSGIRPHIISAKYENVSGKLVIRNVNFFANIVNAKFGLSDDAAHRVQANTLAVYDLNDLNNPIIPRTVLPDTEPQILPYEITIPPDASGISLVARFEYWKDNNLIRASRFSMPPINMEDGTDLTEEQLYPNLFQSEQPTLTIDAPPYFALKKGAGDNQWISADIDPPVKAVIIPKATSNYTSMINISGVCTLTSTGSFLSNGFDIIVHASEPGDCPISVTLIFADGKELTADATIKIVSETDKLILLSPPEGAVLQANQNMTLRWDAPGAQTGVMFDVSVDSGIVASDVISPKEFRYRVPGAPGPHAWTVTMKDASGTNVIATKDGSFNVSNIDADFIIDSTPIIINWPPSSPNQGNVIAPPPSEINLSITASPPGYAYEWNYSNMTLNTQSPHSPQNPVATIDAANIPVSTSQYYSITLTVRDSQGNAVGMKTKGITVMNYPRFTVAQFSTAEPYIIDFPTNPASFSIPNILFTDPPEVANVAPITVGNCDSLKNYAGQAVNPVAYNVPATGDTLTCTINEGKIINGYVAANAITATLQIRGQYVCGDGFQTGEECDDKNFTIGDGCNDSCHQEAGWDCSKTKIDAGITVSDCQLTFESKCVGLPRDDANGLPGEPGYATMVDGSGSQNTNRHTYYNNKGTPTNLTDDECWVLAESPTSCSTACSTVNLTCVNEDWNDADINGDGKCDICSILSGTDISGCFPYSGTKDTGAPFTATLFAQPVCRIRNSTSSQICSQTMESMDPYTNVSRICKCEASG